MFLNEVQALYASHTEWFLGGGAAAAVLVPALVLFIRYRCRTADQRKVLKVVRRLTPTFLRDVVLPDGLDGFMAFDYLLLTPKGILALDVQNYGGVLFGGDKIDQWTQMVKHKSFKFDNPLHINLARVQAVKALAREVSVSGRVVFAGSGSFPKGVPGGVSMLDTLADDLGDVTAAGEVPDAVQTAWENVKAAVQEPVKA